MNKVEYHVDDYGLTPLTMQRIEECAQKGCVNGISIMPNAAVTKLPQLDDVHWAIHLNLVEGRPLVNPSDIPMLVNNEGYFKYAFGGLLLQSVLHPKEFKREAYLEWNEQVKTVLKLFPKGTKISLDSHQHTHMIPGLFGVFSNLANVYEDKIDYIRIPTESFKPYLKEPSLWKNWFSVNFIKQIVLNFFGIMNKSKLNKIKARHGLFFGILFSGDMKFDLVSKVLPHYIALAEKQGKFLEVLFHSGYSDPNEPLFDGGKESFACFHKSIGRRNEYECIMKLKADEC